MNEVEIFNIKQSIALLKEQLQLATEPDLRKQLTKLIEGYKAQIAQAEE